jgi:carotenoid cleavage dioxygenase-like enzyme
MGLMGFRFCPRICSLPFLLYFFLLTSIHRLYQYLVNWKSKPTRSVYLNGPFQPVLDELTIKSLFVSKGEIPSDINGFYVRNGPNPQFPPRGNYHWFDGDGMIHQIHFENGKASYKNRYVRTEKFQKEKTFQRSIAFGLSDLFDPIASLRTMIDQYIFGIVIDDPYPSNSNLVYHAHSLLSIHDFQHPYEIDVKTLETRGKISFDQSKWDAKGFAQHPKRDPITNELMFFSISHSNPYLSYGVMDKFGQITHSLKIKKPYNCYVHDFAITAKFTIFVFCPLIYKHENVWKGDPPVEYDATLKTHFAIVPRHSNSPRDSVWFETTSCWIWHVVNAYEDDQDIVLHACKYDDVMLFNLEMASAGTLCEYRFDVRSGRVTMKQLSQLEIDFPVIAPRLVGSKEKYVYALNQSRKEKYGSLFKMNVVDGTHVEYKFGSRMGGECCFVPNGDAEDDGYLLIYVNDCETSSLLILDARDMMLLCEIDVSRRVPLGFHGIWVDMAQTKKYQSFNQTQ